MNKTTGDDDQLDQLLRQWNDQSQSSVESSVESLDALQRRISTAIKQTGVVEGCRETAEETQTGSGNRQVEKCDAVCPATRNAGQSTSKWRTWHTVAISIALVASIVLGIVIWQQRSGESKPDSIATPNKSLDQTPQFARWEEGHLSGQSILFSGMEQVFEEQLSWVAETNGKVRIGLQDEQGNSIGNETEDDQLNSPAGRRPLTIRVVMACRDDAGSDWTRLWEVNVVSRSERVVRLDSEAVNNIEISLWTFVLPDGMIAIDSTYSSQGSVQLNSSMSNLQKPGEPTSVFSQHKDGKEYRVFQTVSLLNKA